MRVSTQFPIAVHAMLMVAYFPTVRMTSDLIAESVGCNPVIIRNIFSKLKAFGLIHVKPGISGTKLAKDAKEITLWDIYTSIESSDTDELFKIHASSLGTCPVGGNVRKLLLTHLDDAVHAMYLELSKVTLEDMALELTNINKEKTKEEMLKEMTAALEDASAAIKK